jgi:hypothetical protein
MDASLDRRGRDIGRFDQFVQVVDDPSIEPIEFDTA